MGGLNSGPGPGIFLLIAIVFILAQTVSSAPLYEDEENNDGSSKAISQSHGCYYNFRYYNEGERIITNEPCLNCTCRNRMFMCYLRVCPFTKEIGQNCTIEKVPGQCCPIIACPEVPVHLLTSSSTTELSEGSKESEISQENAIGHFEGNGCQIEGIFYPNGAQVPSSSEKPCELCYCIRNKTSCIMQTCALHVDGCRPVYEDGQCFPVRYQCDDSAYQEPEPTTTYRPPPATGLLFTTTSSEILECTHNNEIYEDGARIQTEDPCEHCYCLKGKIACAIQECGIPLEKEGQNCTALPPPSGKCCPDSYQCDVTMTSQNVGLSTERPVFITKPTFQNLEESAADIASNEQKKHPLKNEYPEDDLKPLAADKEKTQTLMPNSVPNENFSGVFSNKISTKSSLTTKNYEKVENYPDLERTTEKYQTTQDSLTEHLNKKYVTQNQTPSFEYENVSLQPVHGTKEDLLNKNSIKEAQLTQKNESSPNVELTQSYNVVSEKLPAFKDKNSQHRITPSETDVQDDHKKPPKPDISHETSQPSKVNAEHDMMTIAAEKNPHPYTKPATHIKDDMLLNKLHYIIQDVQAQVNEGKTTSIPEKVDYGITLSNQKGHFTDKPESLIHTQQTNQDTQLFYDNGQTVKPIEDYGHSELEGTQNNNEIFNKLPGFIHDIYQQITSTLMPLKQQETISTSTKDDSLISFHDHSSIKQPSSTSTYKVPPLPNEETSKYLYQLDLKEQTTEYQIGASQNVFSDKNVSPVNLKPNNFYNSQNSIKINSTVISKKPSYENVQSTLDTTTVEIFTDTTKATAFHHYLPSENLHKEFDKLSDNKISKPTGHENIIYSTTHSFEEATDVGFESNNEKNLSVSNLGESNTSFNIISGTTIKYTKKKKPVYSQGAEHPDITKVTLKSEDSIKDSFLVTSESQKHSTDYPNEVVTEIDNVNKKVESHKRKPATQSSGHHTEINYTGEEDFIEEPDNSTPFNHFVETGTVESESVTFKPHFHKHVTKYPHIDSTQNSGFYSEDFTESFIPTYPADHDENSAAHIKRKPEINTGDYIKPETPEHFTDSTEITKEKFTARPHDYYSNENNFQESFKPLQNAENKKETTTLNTDNKFHYSHKPENYGITFDRHDPTRYSNVPPSTSKNDYFNKESTTTSITEKHPSHNVDYFEDPNGHDGSTKYLYDQSTIDSNEYTEKVQENFSVTTEHIKDLTGQSHGQTTKKPFAEGSENLNETLDPTALNESIHVISPTKFNRNDSKPSDAESFINKLNESQAFETEKENEGVFPDDPNLIDVTQYTTSGYKVDSTKPEIFIEDFVKLPNVNIGQQTSQKYPHTHNLSTIKPPFSSKSPYDISALISEDHSTQSKPITEKLNIATSSKLPPKTDQFEELKPEKTGVIDEQYNPQKKRPSFRPEETNKTESLEKDEMTKMPGVLNQNVQHFDQHPGHLDKLSSDNHYSTNFQQTYTSTSLTDVQPGFHTIHPLGESVKDEVSFTHKPPYLKPEQHDMYLINEFHTGTPPLQIPAQTSLPNSELYPSKKRPVKPSLTLTDIKKEEEIYQSMDPEKHLPVNERDKIFKQPHNETKISSSQESNDLGHTSSTELPNELTTQNYVTEYQNQKSTENPDDLPAAFFHPKEKPKKPFVKPQETHDFNNEGIVEELEKSTADLNLFTENYVSTTLTQTKFRPLSTTDTPIKKSTNVFHRPSENAKPVKTETEVPQETTKYLFTTDHENGEHNIFQTTEYAKDYFTETPPKRIDNEQEKQSSTSEVDKHLTTPTINTAAAEDSQQEVDQIINKPEKRPNVSEFNLLNDTAHFNTPSISISSYLEQDMSSTENSEETVSEKIKIKLPAKKPEDSDNKYSSDIHKKPENENLQHYEKPHFTTNDYEETSSDPVKKPYLPPDSSHLGNLNLDNKLTVSNEDFEPPFLTLSTYHPNKISGEENKHSPQSFNEEEESFKRPSTDKSTTPHLMYTPENLESSTHTLESFSSTEDPKKISTTKSQNKEGLIEIQSTLHLPDSEDLIDNITHHLTPQDFFGVVEPSKKKNSSFIQQHSSSLSTLPENPVTMPTTFPTQHNQIQKSSTSNHLEVSNDTLISTYSPEEFSTKIIDTKQKFSTHKPDAHNEENLSEQLSEKKTTQPLLPHQKFETSGSTKIPLQTSQHPTFSNDDSLTTIDSSNAKFTISDFSSKFPIDDSTDSKINLSDIQTRPTSIFEHSYHEKVSTSKVEISTTKPHEHNILIPSDNLEQITTDTPKHSASSILYTTPINEGKLDTLAQETDNQKTPKDSSTVSSDTSSILEFSRKPDSVFYTTTHPDQIMITTLKANSNQNLENSYTEKNYSYSPEKISNEDDFINKLHGIIQEVQTQKHEIALKSTSKIPNNYDFFTVDSEIPPETTSEHLVYEDFTNTHLSTSYQKLPEIATERFTEKSDATTGFYLEIFNQEPTKKYSVGIEKTEIPETHRSTTNVKFDVKIKPEDFTTKESSNIKEGIMSTTSYKGALVTNKNVEEIASSKSPVANLDSQFQNPEVQSVTQSEFLTSTKSFKYTEQPTTYNINEEIRKTLKPDNKFPESDADKHKPSDIFEQTLTTTSNPVSFAFTTKSSHPLLNYTSIQTKHPSSLPNITNKTHLVGAFTSTESYGKTTVSPILNVHNLHDTKYTVLSPTDQPENNFAGVHFNKILPTKNASSLNTIVVTPNVGSFEETLQYSTTTNPIHLVYPTYYPNGTVPHKPVNEPPKDQNDLIIQTNKILEKTSEPSLNYTFHSTKMTAIPDIENITEEKTEYTSYEIQTEISSESVTGKPVVIIEEIKTEVHSEKATAKPNLILQENDSLGNNLEHLSVDYPHEFNVNKISSSTENEESLTEKVNKTQFYPSKEQISTEFNVLIKKPGYVEDESKNTGTHYPYTQVTEVSIQQPQQTTKDDHIIHLYSLKDKHKTTTSSYHQVNEKTQTKNPMQTLLPDLNSFQEISTDFTIINYPNEENEKIQGSTQTLNKKQNISHQIFGSKFQVEKTTIRPDELEQIATKSSSNIVDHFTHEASQNTDRPLVEIIQELSKPDSTRPLVSATYTPFTESEMFISGTTNKMDEQEFLTLKNSTNPSHDLLPEKFLPTENASSTDGISFVPFKNVNGTKIYYFDKEQTQKPIDSSSDDKLYDGYDMLPYKIMNGSKVFYPQIVLSTDKPSYSALPVLGMYVPYKIINKTKVYFTEDQPDNKGYDGLDYVPFEIVDGKKVFYPERVAPFTATTAQSHIQGLYIPYKVINGSKVFFPEDAQNDSKNIDGHYDGIQYIPHKWSDENNIQETSSNISSPLFQALYVPFKVRNNTKIYYPKDALEKPLTDLKDYDGFDYVPFEISNGIKVFYPEKGISSYLTSNSIPFSTVNAQNNYPQNYQHPNYPPNFDTFPSKLTLEKLPSDFPDSAMFVPFKLINGTKVFYIADAQHKPHNILQVYDGVEYVPYELKNGTKVFEPDQMSLKPLQVIFVPYKIVNESKIFYPMDSSRKPILSLPNKYDGFDYFFYESKNGTDVFYSSQNRPSAEFETKGMFLPYKIFNGSKVFYPEDAKYQSQYIPEEYDGFEFTPYEVINGTKVFYPTKTEETNKPFLNELHSNGMYVPYKMINNTKVYYVNEAQNRPHPLSDEYHGLDYLPYEVINNTANIFSEKFNIEEMVPMYVPFKLINGTKVYYPNDAHKEPQLFSNKYDGYNYLPLHNLQNNVVFYGQDGLTSTTSQSIFKSAFYVPYKISNGAKIFHPKDAQEKPELIPQGYDGFEYIPYEIIDGKKVFHPEEVIESTTKPTIFSHSLYVPFKIINGTKIYYPALSQNEVGQVPHGYDGFDYIPYEIVDGKKVFHPEKIDSPTSIPSLLGSYVPFKIINETKIYYPALSQNKIGQVPHGYDGFDYIPYEIIDGKKVFHPEKIGSFASTPSSLGSYVPYKVINGTKVYYTNHAQEQAEPLQKGYDGLDYLHYDIVDGKKIFKPQSAAARPATSDTLKNALYVPFRINNGTKVFYPKDAQDNPYKIPAGYNGFEYIPYEIIDGKKVFRPEEAIKLSTKPMSFSEPMYIPYKIVNGTKIYYPSQAKLNPEKLQEGYDGVDFIPLEVVNKHKFNHSEENVKPSTTPENLKYIFVPYKLENGTKTFYPNEGKDHPQEIKKGFDGFDYIPYEIIDGKKVFYPESAIEPPPKITMPYLNGIFVPYKLSNETKIFYPANAQENHRIPLGYDGVEYVPYENINGTKIFYPELISVPIPGATEVYVPYKISDGKKIFQPEIASTKMPTDGLQPFYDGIAYVSYKNYFQRPDKPFFGTNSEVIYVYDEEGLKSPINSQNQNTNYDIPGEGSCLVNNKTYKDNSEIPSFNPCQVKCKCINSIVRCVRIKCPSTTQGIKKNCSPTYKEDSCCPIYDCVSDDVEQPTTISHNHILTEEVGHELYLTTTQSISKKPFPETGNDLAKKPYEKDNQYIQKLPKPNPDPMDPYDNVEGLVSEETTPDDEYGDDDEPYGPGTCRYAGKIYVSAQQIPRDDPCDFCFCFRSDIICLQQSCPPPIPGCRDEPIHGFCCPRYECHVKMATLLNVTSTTTTTTTTLPPHFFSHAYKGSASRTGCFVQGKAYRVGQAIPSASGPCMDCICGGNGRMKCEPKVCAPEPLIRKMVVPTETTSSSLKSR